MCSWATLDIIHPQSPIFLPCDQSAPKDEPGGGYIFCISSNTPEDPARGLGHQHLVCGDTREGIYLQHRQLLNNSMSGHATAAAALSW